MTTTTTTTTTTTSAPPLQALSEAAASVWLMQWAGVVGFLGTRAPARHSQGRRAKHHDLSHHDTTTCPPKVTARSCFRTHESEDKAAAGPRAAQVTLRYKETVADTTAATQPRLMPPKGRITQEESPTNTQECEVRVSDRLVSASCVPAALDGGVVKPNVGRCSSYLRSHLPPMLLQGVLDTAWRTVSEEVRLGGRENSVPDHQVGGWARRAPVLLALAACLTTTKYPLDLTGLGHEALRDAVSYVEKQFAVERLSTLVLSKRKARRGSVSCPLQGDVMKRLLHKSSLVSLTLNLDLVNGNVLKEISRMSLQELDVCGGRHSEAQVVQELCGLPFTTVDQVVEAVRGGHLPTLPRIPLRESLHKLTISLPDLPTTLYQVLLAVFNKLHHYTPPSGATPCVSGYARITRASGSANPLSLRSLNLCRASRHDILEVAKICPDLRDVSLSIELDCEETLSSLQSCERLSGVQLSYFPSSVSSPPKVEGRVLLPLLDFLGPQLLSLGLTGFSLRGGEVAALAGRPELRRLVLTDCWLACPDTVPSQPFSSLDSLALNFLPSMDILKLLTAASCLQSLAINVVASEARGNGLTDGSVRQLVCSRAISSIHSFSSSSPFLTLASLHHLAALPRLNTVGSLARWGLTQEELGCVGHSGPSHVLCRP